MALSPVVPQPSQSCRCALIACWFYCTVYQKGYPKQASVALLIALPYAETSCHLLDHTSLAALPTICETIAKTHQEKQFYFLIAGSMIVTIWMFLLAQGTEGEVLGLISSTE